MNTKIIGDASVAKVEYELVKRGAIVLVPRGDHRPYDLAVDTGGRLVRVQVRKTQVLNGKPFAHLRKITHSGSKVFYKTYGRGEIDFLVSVLGEDCWILPFSEIDGKRNSVHLHVRGQFKNAWNLLVP